MDRPELDCSSRRNLEDSGALNAEKVLWMPKARGGWLHRWDESLDVLLQLRVSDAGEHDLACGLQSWNIPWLRDPIWKALAHSILFWGRRARRMCVFDCCNRRRNLKTRQCSWRAWTTEFRQRESSFHSPDPPPSPEVPAGGRPGRQLAREPCLLSIEPSSLSI